MYDKTRYGEVKSLPLSRLMRTAWVCGNTIRAVLPFAQGEIKGPIVSRHNMQPGVNGGVRLGIRDYDASVIAVDAVAGRRLTTSMVFWEIPTYSLLSEPDRSRSLHLPA
jgi:hypothetical protein